MPDHASNQGANDPRAPSHTAGQQRSANPDEAQLPLLSDTDHDIDDQPSQNSDVPSHRHANKDSRDDWHWLERLVFKTRFHFIVSVTLFFVFWTFVALIFSGDWPGNDIRWPWSKRPGNRAHLGNDFYEAQDRLADQPFCQPKVGLLQLIDVQAPQPNETLSFDIDSTDMDGFGRRSFGCPSPHSIPWRNWLGSDFDKLAGTTVREAAKRRRETVDLVMSVAQGAPFYTRKATMCSLSSSLRTGANTIDHRIFRSRKLWQAVQQLAWAASLYANDGIMPEQILQALRLDHTRIVREPHHNDHAGSYNQTEALQTTILDAQKFVQSLLAIYYGLEQPVETFLNDAVIHHFFTVHELSTDSSTGSTHSPFDLVRKDLPRRYAALSGVGHLSFGSVSRLQQRNKPFQLYVLHEVYGDHELDIALDLERGLIVSILARLALDHDEPKERKDCLLPQESKSKSPWDWILQRLPSVLLDITWRSEGRDRASLAGTYRYESGLSSDSTAGLSPASFDWAEVDVGIEDAVPWITRIEFAPVTTRSSSTTAQVPFSADPLATDKSNGSVSVLKKYNVGGTSDFLAGWTCKWSQDEVADCYRPRVGQDDSRCSCKDWRTGATSSYRVGLWPVQEEGQVDTNVFHIPPAAIRLDGNSYMDQGVGGCSALFRPDEEQHVPEMKAFGYTLKFTKPERNDDGTIRQETQLEWLKTGLKMKRVSEPQCKS